MKWVIGLMFSVVVSADTSSWITGHYEIRGYSKKSQSSGSRIEIKAEMAKGFSFGGFEEIERPEITIESSQGILLLTSDHGLSKEGEIILEGHATAELGVQKKRILLIKSSVLNFQMGDFSLRSPSAEFNVKGRTRRNLSIHVDLQKRKIFSPQENLHISF